MRQNGSDSRFTRRELKEIEDVQREIEMLAEDIRSEIYYSAIIRAYDLDTFIRRMEREVLNLKKIREGV